MLCSLTRYVKTDLPRQPKSANSSGAFPVRAQAFEFRKLHSPKFIPTATLVFASSFTVPESRCHQGHK
jgi:hypothetical protein